MECKKCKIDRDISYFVYKNKAKEIRHCVCKICQREYKKKHYYNSKEAHYIRNKQTKDKLKNIVNIKKLKGCYICSESFQQCLEFHHLDKKDKYEDISVLTKLGSIKKLMTELEKCVILCANCHRKTHYDPNFNNVLLNKLNTEVV